MNDFVRSYLSALPKPEKGMKKENIIFCSNAIWAVKEASHFLEQNPDLEFDEGLIYFAAILDDTACSAGNTNAGSFYSNASSVVMDMLDQWYTKRALYFKNMRRRIYE